MKAVVFESYGQPEVLKIKEIEKPEVPDDAVLVRVHASSINVAEWYGMTGLPIARILGGGLVKPKDTRLGADFAGVVEAVGKNVSDFKIGDEVFGGRSGAYAEYVSVKNAIVLKPANVTMEEAASVPTAGITALQGFRDHAKLQPGQKVLINGASGGVGTFAIQIAKAFGADVTAVCSTKNVEHARALGADHVIDYTKADFTVMKERYDVIFDTVAKFPKSQYSKVLASNGTYVSVAKLDTKENMDNLIFIKELIEKGKIKAVIDRCYPLDDMVEAHRYVDTGRKKGNVVIKVRRDNGR